GVAAELHGRRPEAARLRLRALVSRETTGLPEGLLASAAIESLAENLADSVTAPLLAFCLFGLPGAAVYRVVNTADAMFGYRGELDRLGKVVARTDDVLSWLPSRLSALAVAAAAWMLLGRASAARALTSIRDDGGVTASPNAGQPMAAMSGALGRRLEKRGHYVIGGAFGPPGPDDIGRSVAVTG